MKTDHIQTNILIEVATETNVSVAEATMVLDKYYKSIAKHKVQGVPKIKLDYLGSFEFKPIRERNADSGFSSS